MNNESTTILFSRIIKRHGELPIDDPFRLLQIIEKAFKEGYCLALRDHGTWENGDQVIGFDKNKVEDVITKIKETPYT